MLLLATGCSASAAPVPGDTGPGDAVTPPGGQAWVGRTQIGYAVWPHPGETFPDALTRQRAALGQPGVVRYFYGPRPLEWPPKEGFTGSTPLVVSFNRPPKDVLAGTHDGEIRDFLGRLPRDRVTWVAYEHEMDAKAASGDYTPTEIRAAFIRVARLINATRNPMIRRTLILTGWDYRNRLRLYWPGAANVDVLGVDIYQWTDEGVGRLFDGPLAVAAAYHKPLGIAEFGVWQGSDEQRAAFVGQVIRRLRGKVVFLTYFNADRDDVPGDHDWEISDLPLAAAAWRRASAG